ncbi:MAG TPA: tail fiber protein, partial [Stellaceae bacterium]|nr:tail fiber protein [Stellaceae bacterium]
NFAPVNWAMCEGQILPISQNTALFSLLGTNFGGNGINTFALPDLRSRVPVGVGQGGGLSNYGIGEFGGQETASITASSYPNHTHPLLAAASAGSGNAPAGLIEAEGQSGGRGGAVNLALYSASGTATTLAPAALTAASGGGLPHTNLQPYLALNFCIALVGVFPQRS